MFPCDFLLLAAECRYFKCVLSARLCDDITETISGINVFEF